MSDQTMRSLHQGIDTVTQSGDQRLVYGIGVPVLAVTALIIAFVLQPTWYFLALVLVSVLAIGGIVIWGILRMLGDEEGAEGS